MGKRASGTFGATPVIGVEVSRVDERSVMIEKERQVGDGKAHLQEHPLVKGLDGEEVRREGFRIKSGMT